MPKFTFKIVMRDDTLVMNSSGPTAEKAMTALVEILKNNDITYKEIMKK